MEANDSTLIETYKIRPPELEDLNLINFCKHYRVYNNKFIKRRKECIVRIFPKINLVDNETEDEKYYKLHCILNVSFRNNKNDILINNVNHDSWKELYNSLNISEENEINLHEYEETDEIPESLNDDMVRNPF